MPKKKPESLLLTRVQKLEPLLPVNSGLPTLNSYAKKESLLAKMLVLRLVRRQVQRPVNR